jgi:tetratricopeptide (TPR) repeat protein
MARGIPVIAKLIFVGTALLLPYALSAQATSDEAVQRSNEGVELLKQSKFSEAIDPLLKAVELNPKDPNVRLNLAYAYDRQGRLDEAVIHYQKAIELNPRDSVARNNLGVLYNKAGRYDKAIRELEKTLEIDPKSATAPKNLETAKKNQSALQEREKRIAEAVKNVESNPENASAHYNLARLYAFYDKKDLAIPSLEKALKLGYSDIGYVKVDTALDSIRNEPDYVWLLRGR